MGLLSGGSISLISYDEQRLESILLQFFRLPYGWDEAYTAEGVKYFINHVTQTTSWSPPVTPVSPKSPPAPERVTEGGRGEEEGEEEEKEEEEEKGKTNTSV
ncbi:unnamed protein product [Boreogadus saida]